MQEVQFEQIKISPAFKASSFDTHQTQQDTKTLSKTILQQDLKLVEKQINQLNKFSQGMSSLASKLNKSQGECTLSIETLQKQSYQLEENISNYQKNLNSNTVKNVQNQIQTNKKRYISLWEQRISISEQLNIQNLQQIEIEDRKSIANQLFKWIVVTIYGQNESKFYLPNFKAQLFQKDNGKDFKQRLGKINAANAKEEQIVKARDFLSKYADIIECQEIQNAKTQAETLKKVAQIFIQCNELAKKSSDLEKSIESDKEKSLQKDEQAMKWKARHEALQQRIQVLNQYMETLKKTEEQLQEQDKTQQNKLVILQLIRKKLSKCQLLSETDLDTLAQV